MACLGIFRLFLHLVGRNVERLPIRGGLLQWLNNIFFLRLTQLGRLLIIVLVHVVKSCIILLIIELLLFLVVFICLLFSDVFRHNIITTMLIQM